LRDKLLVVTERYWPEGGGGELATHLVLNMLRKCFEIIVVAGSKDPIKVPDVKFVYEPLLSARNKQLLWANAFRLSRLESFKKLISWAEVVYVPRFTFPVIPSAKKMHRKVVVHLHDYIPVSYTATVLAPFEEHRCRITRDDFKLECMKGLNYCAGVALSWWLPKLARKWISEADTLICVSKRQAQIISELATELRSKIKVVYNPTPNTPSVEKNMSEKAVFVYVGGGSYVKGYHVLVEALKIIGKKRRLNAKFILTNTYTHQQVDELMSLKKKYGLDVEIQGRVGREDLLKLHSKAWALLFPSVWEEPLPYALIESCLLKTVPIASSVGGVPELIGNTPAKDFMFYPGIPKQLTEKIKIVASREPKEVHEIANAVYKAVREKINNEAIEKELINIFRKRNDFLH